MALSIKLREVNRCVRLGMSSSDVSLKKKRTHWTFLDLWMIYGLPGDLSLIVKIMDFRKFFPASGPKTGKHFVL